MIKERRNNKNSHVSIYTGKSLVFGCKFQGSVFRVSGINKDGWNGEERGSYYIIGVYVRATTG